MTYGDLRYILYIVTVIDIHHACLYWEKVHGVIQNGYIVE